MPSPKSKVKNYGFIANVGPDSSYPKEVVVLRKFIEKGVGLPCKKFDAGCSGCRVWEAWAVLADFYETFHP